MMIQGAPVVLGGKKKSNVPAFSYTGKYNVRDDDVVELLESGEITFVEDGVIDVFMVGGGGGGNYIKSTTVTGAGGGGGGGYTRTVRRVNVTAGQQIPVTVGSGGTTAAAGGGSGWNTFAVSGGASQGAASGTTPAYPSGSAGGSGGGAGVNSYSEYGTGGSDGNNGEQGYPTSVSGGAGQGFTTREFGESTGKLYAGGGGGGRYSTGSTPVASSGGEGGGGAGGWINSSGGVQAAATGETNTGGGGGGGARYYYSGTQNIVQAASGGSGIVCFRDAAALPELAGTWVLNERLYAPESNTAYNGNATITNTAGTSRAVTYVGATTAVYSATLPNGNNFTLYNFSTNVWSTDLGKNTQVTFPSGATASNEFRAWLASNATKQS